METTRTIVETVVVATTLPVESEVTLTRHVPLPGRETATPDLVPTDTISIPTHVPLPAAETATPKLITSVTSIPTHVPLPALTPSLVSFIF